MILFIENEFLAAKISSRGAEPLSLIEKKTGRELLWQGGAGSWRDHCYQIFPVAGRLRGGAYFHCGRRYEMPLHGFALKSEFTVAEAGEHFAAFRLCESEETLQCYPFRFVYEVTLSLAGRSLLAEYRATNCGTQTMYCGLGAHPGFLLPLDGNTPPRDHKIYFDRPVVELELNENKLRTGTRRRVEGAIALTQTLFSRGARMYETGGAVVTLRANGRALVLDAREFSHLVLWSDHESLICVEPWSCASDAFDASGELRARAGTIALAEGESVQKRWTLEVTDEEI